MNFVDLTLEEKETFRLYKGNSPFGGRQFFADHLNTSLATGQQLEPDWEQQAKNLDSLIAKSASSHETVVFRATLEMYLSSPALNEEFVYRTYVSTAAEEHAVIRHFASPMRDIPAALLRIHCPVGTHMLNLETNSAFGGLEQEYLLPRSSKFKVISITRESDPTAMAQVMGIYATYYSELAIYELAYVGAA